jgi:hypothetical protein
MQHPGINGVALISAFTPTDYWKGSYHTENAVGDANFGRCERMTLKSRNEGARPRNLGKMKRQSPRAKHKRSVQSTCYSTGSPAPENKVSERSIYASPPKSHLLQVRFQQRKHNDWKLRTGHWQLATAPSTFPQPDQNPRASHTRSESFPAPCDR